MRKLIVHEFVTLDGVMQAPGGRTRTAMAASPTGLDPPYWHDDIGATFGALMQDVDALLLGRRTYVTHAEAFEPMPAGDLFGDLMNAPAKYVVSRTLEKPIWRNTTIIRDDVVGAVRALKTRARQAPIVTDGSSQLVHALIENDLVDELHLHVYPLALGAASACSRRRGSMSPVLAHAGDALPDRRRSGCTTSARRRSGRRQPMARLRMAPETTGRPARQDESASARDPRQRDTDAGHIACTRSAPRRHRTPRAARFVRRSRTEGRRVRVGATTAEGREGPREIGLRSSTESEPRLKVETKPRPGQRPRFSPRRRQANQPARCQRTAGTGKSRRHARARSGRGAPPHADRGRAAGHDRPRRVRDRARRSRHRPGSRGAPILNCLVMATRSRCSGSAREGAPRRGSRTEAIVAVYDWALRRERGPRAAARDPRVDRRGQRGRARRRGGTRTKLACIAMGQLGEPDAPAEPRGPHAARGRNRGGAPGGGHARRGPPRGRCCTAI